MIVYLRSRLHHKGSGRRHRFTIRLPVVQLPAQKKLAIDLLRLQKIVGLDVDGVGQELQLGTDLDKVAADLRPLVDQETLLGGEGPRVFR